ncbi:MAG: C4-type zinc ribbon domain-containing protein [Desulfotomaculaceae bacterium]
MPDLKQLWEIQMLDGQRKALEQKLREGQFSGELKSLKADIEQGRLIFNKLKEEYSSQKRVKKTKEMDVASASDQIKSLGEKLYGGSITNPKEVNTSSLKLESLDEKVKRTEDEILAIMEEQDDLRSRLEAMSAELSKKAEDYRKKHGTLLASQEKVRQQLAKIPLSRQKMLKRVDADLWQMYTEIQRRFDDPLAKVEKSTCMGCRVNIPFHHMRRLRQGDELVLCSHCGRMLYWDKQV